MGAPPCWARSISTRVARAALRSSPTTSTVTKRVIPVPTGITRFVTVLVVGEERSAARATRVEIDRAQQGGAPIRQPRALGDHDAVELRDRDWNVVEDPDATALHWHQLAVESHDPGRIDLGRCEESEPRPAQLVIEPIDRRRRSGRKRGNDFAQPVPA